MQGLLIKARIIGSLSLTVWPAIQQIVQVTKSFISKHIDLKSLDELTTEEKLDLELRANGSWDLESWRGERPG